MRLKFLTWSAYHVTTETGHHFVFDPYLSGNPSRGIPPSPVAVDQFDHVDFVVVSHSTGDHWGQAVELVSRYDALLLCGKDVSVHAMEAGIPSKSILHFTPGNAYRVDGLWLKAVPAVHTSIKTRTDSTYITGYPLSFFLREPSGATLFFGGDTSLHSDLKLFGDLYHPDVALLGVGGGRGNTARSGVLDPVLPVDEAAVAARMLGVRYAIPMHFIPETGVESEFAEAFSSAAPEIEPVILHPGEEFEFGKRG